MAGKTPVLVIGHKNPDTDSVCSALAYARLKTQITGEEYIAKRAGHLNEETQYVLDKFGVKAPEYLKDVSTQVKDIEIRETKGVSGDISIKDAWALMKEQNVVTLPVVEKEKLVGLITISDIAKSYMEVYDSDVLSAAKTGYKNIVAALEGSVEVGDENECFDSGKVIIAAANPDMMENFIDRGDLVILGNRYEAQLCAIEMNAGCIVLCEGAKVSFTIKKLAAEKGCMIISTPFDTFTVARFINQSIPIRFFMKSEGLITFHEDDFIDNIQEVMAKKRFRDFPILDKDDRYIGMISRRNLLGANRKRVILVDHNERSQAVAGIEEAQILEIIDHHRLGTIETISPVYFRNQPLGCTATIIYQMYKENSIVPDAQTAGLLCAAILSDTLIYRSPTCTPFDRESAKELAELANLNDEEFAKNMFKAGSNLSSKSVKEIFYQDFKRFTVNDISFGVGQINSMSEEELTEIKAKVIEYISTENVVETGTVFFMLTNIMTESSELICSDEKAKDIISTAFNVNVSGDSVNLKGIVSRKKQLVPAIMEALQQ